MTASARLMARDGPPAQVGGPYRFSPEGCQTVAVLRRPGKVAEHPPVAVHPAALHGRRQLWQEAAALGHLLKDDVIICCGTGKNAAGHTCGTGKNG